MPKNCMKTSSVSIPPAKKLTPHALALQSSIPGRSSCLWKPRHKRAGCPLVLSIVFSSAGDRLLFGEGNSRRFEQCPPHRNGTDPCQWPTRRFDGHHDVGPPMEPFKKIIWMAGVIPEALTADATSIPGLRAKARQLPVRDRFTGDCDNPQQESTKFPESEWCSGILNHDQKRKREGGHGNGLQLEVAEHLEAF